MRNKWLPWFVAPWMGLTIARAEGSADAVLRKCVEAGNQAWVDGLKSGDPRAIVAPYEADGVDCTGAGECLRGKAAVERHYAERIRILGRATWAEVRPTQLVRDGEYAYEWGRAEARFPGGKEIKGRYATVWRQQKDGSWKIFRNMPLP